MPKFVFHYFDIIGKGEVIRLLFRHANVEFEDRRIAFEEWPKLKGNGDLFPFGQIPVLEVDGVVLAQSEAIIRYLADEFGLNGSSNWEKARIGMLYEGLIDIGSKFLPFYRAKTEEEKIAIKKAYIEEHLPKGLKKFEEKFAPQEGFFVGDKISLCDIRFLFLVQRSEMIEKGILESFPLLKSLYERIRSSPNLKKYLAEQTLKNAEAAHNVVI